MADRLRAYSGGNVVATADLVDDKATLDVTDVDLVVFYAGDIETESVVGSTDVAAETGEIEVEAPKA
jgi:hypothetical protein